MHQYPARLVELDPQTGKPKQREWKKPEVRKLRLTETPKVIVLIRTARSKVPFVTELMDLALSLAYYADNLNRTLAGELVPKCDTVYHTGGDFQVGELSAAAGKQCSINATCGGCVKDILRRDPWRAVDRLRELSAELGEPIGEVRTAA